MICVFLTPLIFYELPLSVRVDQIVFHLTTNEIFYATIVWVTWIFLAGSIVVVGQKSGNFHKRVWHISQQGVWWCFIGFATLGSMLSALHQTMVFPQIFENLAHILSLSSTLAIILGIYLLRSVNLSQWNRLLIIMLLIPCIIITFGLPVLLGYVNPIAISGLGVLYALGVMRISLRTQIGIVTFFIVGIGLALAYKSDLRAEIYGGAFERDTRLVSWHQKLIPAPETKKPSSTSCIDTTDMSSHELEIDTAKHIISSLIAYDTNVAITTSSLIRSDTVSRQAKDGSSSAMFSLGFLAEQNADDRKAMRIAEYWYRRAIEHGHSSAMLRLGHLHEKGLLQPPDVEEAIRWYRQAADGQNRNAMKILSTLYEYGYGVTKSYGKAMELDIQGMGLRLTERDFINQLPKDSKNIKIAMRKLGLLYEKGMRVGKDLTKASRWYERAAILGDGEAMRYLGVMYESGNGHSYDLARALACYNEAAENGDGPAMRIIGRMYELGGGLPKDYALAHEWYSRAADLKDAAAIRRLAALYEKGHGVQQDLLRAKALFAQAQTIEPFAFKMKPEDMNKTDNLEEYDPNYDKLRWPFSTIKPSLYHIVARIAHRLNSLGNLAFAIKMTPSQVPYSHWETYEPLFYKLIPRVIWKDKPVEKTGLVIGLKYGFSKPTDKPFVWSMPTIFESWMAFGWGGIVITAIAIGLCLRLAWHFLVGTSSAAGNLIFGTLIIMSTAHLSMSSLNLVIGGMIHNLMVFGLLIFSVIKISQPRT